MKWKIILGIIISTLFLFFAFRNVDIQELIISFKSADYKFIVPAIALNLLSIGFRSIRWKYLLRPVKEIGIRSLLSAIFIGFMANGVLPVRLGEFIRAYVIGKKENVSKSLSFATIVVARMFDGMTIMFFLVVILLGYSYSFPEWIRNSVYIAFFFYFLALGFLILLKTRPEVSLKIAYFLLKPFPEKINQLATRILNSFITGLGILSSTKNMLIASLYSLLVWIPSGFLVYILAGSFGMELSLSASFLLLVILVIGMMIPSAPASIGTIQYFCVVGLAIFGISKATALSFSIVLHFCTLLPVVLLGFVFLFIDGFSLMELKKSANQNAKNR
jgi:uncharacterized protein (TIRG00374 family)